MPGALFSKILELFVTRIVFSIVAAICSLVLVADSAFLFHSHSSVLCKQSRDCQNSLDRIRAEQDILLCQQKIGCENQLERTGAESENLLCDPDTSCQTQQVHVAQIILGSFVLLVRLILSIIP